MEGPALELNSATRTAETPETTAYTALTANNFQPTENALSFFNATWKASTRNRAMAEPKKRNSRVDHSIGGIDAAPASSADGPLAMPAMLASESTIVLAFIDVGARESRVV